MLVQVLFGRIFASGILDNSQKSSVSLNAALDAHIPAIFSISLIAFLVHFISLPIRTSNTAMR
jgi:hypothetical protein